MVVDQDIEGRSAESVEVHLVGVLHLGVGGQDRAHGLDERLQGVGGRVVGQAQGDLAAAAVAHAQVVDVGVGDRAVGHGDDRVVERPDPKAAEADLLDRALHVADLDPGDLDLRHHGGQGRRRGALGGVLDDIRPVLHVRHRRLVDFVQSG